MESQPQQPTTSNRRNSNVTWGIGLIGLGVLFMLNLYFDFLTGFIVAAAFGGVGFVFYAVSRQREENWWALIPAYVMWFVGGIIAGLTAKILPGELFASAIMFAISFPFLYVYLRNHENWWALIPAYVMFALGVMLIIAFIFPKMVAPYIMFSIAAPFLYVYARNREHWWALIPGGIMSVVGLGLLIGALWQMIPVIMIIAGLFLLLRQVSGNHVNEPAEPILEPVSEFEPIRTGPEADKPLE